MKLLKPIALAFLLPATFSLAHASNNPPTNIHPEARQILATDSISWNTKLPLDNEVLTGKLKNGFQYFIRKNTEPEKRVVMYLANKVGSVLESEEQLGLAHFLEHMNFNGLKHFPKNALVDYLQKAGVRFGSDLNAYTSFDETIYQLPIPSDDPELLKNGLQVMRDWAQDALLTTEEIDKERGIVLEEMRGGKGAQQRMRDQYLPLLLNNSHYANRLPIGTEKSISTFKPEVLRQFHKDWYRPDLQSIIIVGDIDVKQMEAEVIRLFSDLKAPAKPRPHVKYKVDLANKNQFMAVTDPEMSYTVGQIIIKHPEEKTETVGDYRRALLKSVYNGMINARMSEILQQSNPPFIQAGGGVEEFLGGLDNLGLYFVAKPGEFENGFKTLVREMDRIQKFGFTQTEFDRVISSIRKNNETAYTERDKKKSESYVQGYMNYFLEKDPALSNEYRYQLTNQLLPSLTLKEVEQIGQKYYVDNNRDVLILAPENQKANLPDEAKINTWFAEVDKEEITAYEDKVSKLPLLAKQPVKGSIVKEGAANTIGVKELVLSNGVKVLLKPTTFKNDEILISAFSPGGTSLYADADYNSASNAAGLVDASGVGQLNNVELQKYLTGKRVGITPYISERSEGFSGQSDKEGLKTMFELLYGYFTEPRLDDDVFQSNITKSLSSIANMENDPNFVFRKSVFSTLYGNNIRRQPASKESIQQINKDRALEIYKDRFADASDFTFTIVGSFTEEEIKPLLEEYIASLPAKNRQEKAKDLGIQEPAKGVETVVNKGKEQKATVQLAYYGDYAYSEEENMNLDALESILNITLIERLREDESGVYGVGAGANYRKFPKPRYSFSIGFGSAVDKAQPLIASTLDEINKIKKNGPTKVDLEKFVIEQKRQLEVQLRENGFWLGHIVNSAQNQEDATHILKYMDDLNKVTVESVKAVADKYLKEDRLFRFILMPDQTAAK
ncbi:M16 family metallopeptidase [Sphingobacterium spiritivorum]|uniref:M16 family metallopeptidase n=1 Tax=Sphingobacterium spiritivorum TaxID=258 RepID=UPI003DA4899E